MHMSAKWFAFIVILFALSTVTLAPKKSHAGMISFGSPDYTFSIPQHYHVEDYGGIVGQTIVSEQYNLPAGVLTVVPLQESELAADEASALHIALLSCDADGVLGSISCTDVVRSWSVSTGELKGFGFYVVEETYHAAERNATKRTRGPLYVLEERHGNGGMFISYNSTGRPERNHLRLIRKILSSFIGD